MNAIFKTYHPKTEKIERKWHLVDVNKVILGRVSTEIATLLMGKHRKDYSPHVDMGDYVVVVNARDVSVTGKKREQKTYARHSGYPGGFRETTFAEMISKSPIKVIELSVRRMLPDNRLRTKRMNRLKVFEGQEHPYEDKLKTKNEKLKNNS